MTKLSTILLGSLLSVTMLNAKDMKCGAGKCGASMSEAKNSQALHHMKKIDEYTVVVSSLKSLIVGTNELQIFISSDKKPVDAKVKVKFFMPEMPGMPYMESKDKGKTTNGQYNTKINLSMGGTWQYQLKFKTADEKVHKIKGSINL